MTMVLGLDLATVSGWAYGRVNANCPTWGSIRFGSPSTPSPEVFGTALAWAQAFLADIRPDVLMMEGLLPPDAMRGHTSRSTRDRLCGLNAIVAAVANQLGVAEIASVQPNDVRAHFIYDRTLKRRAAKAEVMRKCQELGWNVTNDNAADAVACWSYACSLIDPKLALRGSPLFNRIVSVI